MTDPARLAAIDKHVAELAELCDAVQIVATWLAPDGTTRTIMRGSGNWHARQGLCRVFINQDMAEDQAIAIAKHLDPPDDGWRRVSP